MHARFLQLSGTLTQTETELARARADSQRGEATDIQLAEELVSHRRLLTVLETQLEQELGADLSAQWRDRGNTGLQQGASLLATSLHTLRRRMVDLQAELQTARDEVGAVGHDTRGT